MKTNLRFNIRITRVITLVLSLLVFFGSAGSFDVPCIDKAWASDEAGAVRQGDVLKLKTGEWERDFIVLEPDKTNTNKPGSFLLQKDVSEKIAFNYDLDGDDYLEVANYWEKSAAQDWCSDYYDQLPAEIKNNVIGVKTNETESGTDWAGVNNINGTRSGAGQSKDKVFFLSYIEYDSHKDIDGLANGKKWHLRSPYACGDLAVYVCVVSENGRVLNFGYTDLIGARPAMNLDLTAFGSASKCRHGNQATWTLDAEETDRGYRDVVYSWSSDNKECTGTAVCNNCGAEVTETVDVVSEITKEPTHEAEGVRTFKASFADPAFGVQTKSEAIPKKQEETSHKTSTSTEVLDNTLPGLKLKSPGRSKKSLTAKWKKLSKKKQKRIQGIEIQCAADKKFTKIAAVMTAKGSKSTAQLKKLGRKRAYWIRIRTYKYIGNTKHVSAWSKYKKGKTR